MFIYICCEARREAAVPRSHKSVLLRERQVSNKLSFFLICVSKKCHFCVRMFGRYVSMKNGSIVYLGDDGVKELVLICDHVHFSCKNEWT